MAGDLAPTFSNIYPEILDPWVSEQDFRFLIQTVNDGLIKAFKPGGWRAWVDTVLGVATGWLWEDFGAAAVKAKVRGVERFIEGWNGGREGGSGEEGVKVVPLRRTGFLSVSSNSVLPLSWCTHSNTALILSSWIFKSPTHMSVPHRGQSRGKVQEMMAVIHNLRSVLTDIYLHVYIALIFNRTI